MLVLIDNYDSFTYNIVHYVEGLGKSVAVFKNDLVSIDDIYRLSPTHIVISPGPCTPTQAGLSNEVIRTFSGKVPILGVCLGHQCIAEVFGGSVVKAEQPVHGKVFPIRHNGSGVFSGLPSPFKVTRYHSLVVENHSLPSSLEVTARIFEDNAISSENTEIMGIQHKDYDVFGVQFHPEAVLSEYGKDLLQNFLNCKTSIFSNN